MDACDRQEKDGKEISSFLLTPDKPSVKEFLSIPS